GGMPCSAGTASSARRCENICAAGNYPRQHASSQVDPASYGCKPARKLPARLEATAEVRLIGSTPGRPICCVPLHHCKHARVSYCRGDQEETSAAPSASAPRWRDVRKAVVRQPLDSKRPRWAFQNQLLPGRRRRSRWPGCPEREWLLHRNAALADAAVIVMASPLR